VSHLIQLSLEGFGAPATTHCAICGRPLTDPDSVQRGVGPVCAGKHSALGGDKTASADTNIRPLPEPITYGFLFRLLPDGDLETNVPHLVTHHSPTGWSVGYGGSGCADLALNLLEATLNAIGYNGARTEPLWDDNTVFTLAWNLHQDFKWKFIAPMERSDELQRIPFADVVAFITLNSQEHDNAE